MESLDEIKNNPITEIVSKEAMNQIDELISKLKEAVKLQVRLNNLLLEQKKLEQI